MTLLVLMVCGLSAGLWFSLGAYSLRNFRRSELATVCRKRGVEARFSEILRQDEAALDACELWGQLSLLGATAAFVVWLRGSPWDAGLFSVRLIGWMVLIWLLLQILPRAISRVAAERFLCAVWPLLELLIVISSPLSIVATGCNIMLQRMAGLTGPQLESIDTLAEEIQSVVTEGERDGVLESRAGKMIYRLMEFRDEDIRTIMTPRTEIITIEADFTLEQARQELLEAGHSRVPVIGDSVDDMVGILYARDLLEQMSSPQPKTLRELVREPHYIPETTTIESLLETMKSQRLHMAIVLDEYGGVAGLVTLEDILEEIVGDIADEFDDHADEQVQRIDDHTLLVDAHIHLDELNDLYDLEFPEDGDFDTLAGFVFSELGRIPKQGEVVTWSHLQITVLEATLRKLVRLQLRSTSPWPAESKAKVRV